MSLTSLVNHATDKERFQTLEDYISFCKEYLSFVEIGLQAKIVSQNENHYQFYQYRDDADYNITRPINTLLMYEESTFETASIEFLQTLEQLKDRQLPANSLRHVLVCTIYTIQQSIGAALDALPSGRSNQARKVNGDLFERLIRLIISELGIDCVAGTVQVPIKDDNNEILCTTSYQHDLLISEEDQLKIIGSVKTSSKDRIDKIFVDKFLYSKLTSTDLPHIAIFLNDVQRKKTKKENQSGISATFLPGHFKAYTIKLNPLEGVYYCDIRPNMVIDSLLKQHIKTIDHFFYDDLWYLLNRDGQFLEEVEIEEGESEE
ncbi:MAG: hypothetical protein WAN66_00820 [Limnoraphis robusta]|uniref:Restriction endonuclease n=1 Tax=Limnoraphis robusta CS-951 TaxID=1637645 RepID=A0A0F5YLW6_9CYAN|nr:hypothetical protein [Limnoraphis robusta]KKD39632.1 hypothetical protein WN50_02295 [Limnoraphis robusta CS-951]